MQDQVQYKTYFIMFGRNDEFETPLFFVMLFASTNTMSHIYGACVIAASERVINIWLHIHA